MSHSTSLQTIKQASSCKDANQSLLWCQHTEIVALRAVADPTQLHSDKPIILITTVDIGEGRTDQIRLREGDSPHVRFFDIVIHVRCLSKV